MLELTFEGEEQLSINGNDIDFFEILTKQNYEKVYRTVYSFTKDKYITEDSVQQAFIIGYNKLDQLKSKDKFASWLITIALNEAKRMLKHKSNANITSISDYSNTLPESKEKDIELKVDINNVFNKLKQKETEILVLKYYADLTLQQIADLLDINLSNTKVRLHRAKEAFRKLINRDIDQNMGGGETKMVLSENELEQIIKDQLIKELDSNIEVPDIDAQWQKIKNRIIEENKAPIKQKPFFTRKRFAFAAAILISIGSLNFLYPNNANAFGSKIAEFFNYIVGKTTQNKTETYKQANDADIPKVQDLGTNIEKEVTLDQAQTSIPFKLAIPSYLPPETNKRRVVLTSLGSDVYQVNIEYNVKDKVVVYSQQNSANGTSRGSLYDTDDTVEKDLIVNGSPAMLFKSKNGINTLNWQLRGLLLQITGQIPEEEISKIADSIN